jgi:hypothetical protein
MCKKMAPPSVTDEMYQAPDGQRDLQTVVKGSFFVEVPVSFQQTH